MSERVVLLEPPVPSRGLLGDVSQFLLRRPEDATHVEIGDPAAREHYGLRIAHHLGTPVDDYEVLNIHRIGIDAPVDRIFEVIRSGAAATACWPNRLARLQRDADSATNARVNVLGLPFWSLFRLTEVELDDVGDGARKILFRCHGGYPIGIFAMLARPSYSELGEHRTSQFFFVVSFNFYGRPRWWGARVLHGMWESVHNRATGNILNRLRRLCEAART